jgi:hypothetical protein
LEPGQEDGQELVGEPTTPEQGTAPQQRTFTEKEVKELLQKGLSETEAYKSLQRAMSKADREAKAAQARYEAELARSREQSEGLKQAINFLSNRLMRALPDDERAEIESELRAMQIQKMEQELQETRRLLMQPPQVQQHYAPDEDLEERLRVLRAEARDALEEAVREHGLDPSEKGLDYGEEDSPFPTRLKRLNASIRAIKKAKADAEVESVKQKVPLPQTRTDGGIGPDEHFGRSHLERGSDEIYAQIMKSFSQRHKR